ncbi:hypothetical protein FCMLKIFP_00043 [Pseudomonas phage Ka3]|uniref:Uncharacterized protein n=2 Tax=Luzseptimavirus KPP21 TaxID=1982595 RepID=A0A7S6B6E5_9CAUD|nr:hypothetical protein AVU12_gp023 [Pseudomonas phage KPP21]QKE55987.1 hypothetical protein AMP2_gp039 [Pseudomonas phage vB_Pae_AM.P2]QWY17727.1 hypothetical protein [Pseudomonas phage vB_Pae-PA152]UGL60870.1 hypothetical protein [Pseudomonas phage vB_PaeS_TUMS_P6]UNI71953.1 hypothetical protein [Pseudomonas phage vB_PaeP_TUMS_P10]WQZ52393.1 hypothetical protein FCMLKIFP_00043 [Pseudomonas phage Ka3]
MTPEQKELMLVSAFRYFMDLKHMKEKMYRPTKFSYIPGPDLTDDDWEEVDQLAKEMV